MEIRAARCRFRDRFPFKRTKDTLDELPLYERPKILDTRSENSNTVATTGDLSGDIRHFWKILPGSSPPGTLKERGRSRWSAQESSWNLAQTVVSICALSSVRGYPFLNPRSGKLICSLVNARFNYESTKPSQGKTKG
jgi:hypothetical protein